MVNMFSFLVLFDYIFEVRFPITNITTIVQNIEMKRVEMIDQGLIVVGAEVALLTFDARLPSWV